MHELSVALSLVDLACEEMTRRNAVRVATLYLRIGPLSGVVTDALSFAFAAATAGTPVEGARLHIEDVPATVWCASCSAERTLVEVARRRCPVCNATAPQIVRGEELELVALEVIEA